LQHTKEEEKTLFGTLIRTHFPKVHSTPSLHMYLKNVSLIHIRRKARSLLNIEEILLKTHEWKQSVTSSDEQYGLLKALKKTKFEERKEGRKQNQ
jgi:hypothetical protein